ncbi:MAG: Glu-tRNA(Gln) amidotransferase subunit GatE, partial [Nitrososphaerales archaeon]
ALDTALIFSLTLSSKISDEIHVMRKIVVDGSNTSGFQRTAVVALGGALEYESGKFKVPVQSVSVEEDAARAIKVPSSIERSFDLEEEQEQRVYALDRLGTPLVEVALAPIEGGTPDQVTKTASSLGRLMRSTGRVARGLGTIRQDLNVSVMNGSVIEVKGVQRLEQIAKVVEYEAARQKFFFDLAKLVKSKIGNELEIDSFDVTELFRNTGSRILKNAFAKIKQPKVAAVTLKSFSGLIGMENEFHSRLGKELGAIARTYGIGGVFHSDELPDYGITKEEVESVKKQIGMLEPDAFVLVAGEPSKVTRTVEALIERMRYVTKGVPAETRAATEDGETTFLRPRPGAARMYPETDIPLIKVSNSRLEKLKAEIPEPWERVVEKFSGRYDLPTQLAEPLLDSDRKNVFVETVASTKLPARYVASVLLDVLQSLSREGVEVGLITDGALKNIFASLDAGKFAKEAIPELIRLIGKDPDSSLEQALSKAGLGSISKEQLKKIVIDTIQENVSLVKEKGESSESTIMGKVMQKVRGKVDGKLVNETVKEILTAFLEKR